MRGQRVRTDQAAPYTCDAGVGAMWGYAEAARRCVPRPVHTWSGLNGEKAELERWYADVRPRNKHIALLIPAHQLTAVRR